MTAKTWATISLVCAIIAVVLALLHFIGTAVFFVFIWMVLHFIAITKDDAPPIE